MPSMIPTLTTLFALLLTSTRRVAHAQALITVTVGENGSFYNPQVVAARVGDTVSYRFTAPHTVTQGSFAAPCVPLAGGFDSGQGTPAAGIVSVWNLTITDDSSPIWYFCKLSRPVPHCSDGMVGAINAPISAANQSFDAYFQAAKALTSVAPILPGFVLGGIGAIATAAPVPISETSAASTSSYSTSTTSSSTSSSTPVPTPTPTPATEPSTTLSRDQQGGIAGGVIAGAIIIILLALLFVCYRRGRHTQSEAAMLRSRSSRDMSHIEAPPLIYGSVVHDPSPNSPATAREMRSGRTSELIEVAGTASPPISYRELAAEIVAQIRQEGGLAERGRPPQDSLPTVAETLAIGPSAEPTQSRQPPPPSPPTDAPKVLPAYAPAYVPGPSH